MTRTREERNMFGRFFKRKKDSLPSRPEFLAGYMIRQFLPDHHWQIPQADLDNYVKEAGPEFRPLIGYWILIYCAWLFRLAALRQFGEAFEQDMLAAMRARLQKPEAARVKKIASSSEFWFKKLDMATSEAMQASALKGVPVPTTYFAAFVFVILDADSPWHMHDKPPDASLHRVTMTLAKVHDRMIGVLPRIMERVARDGRTQSISKRKR
jgi:hypothetical protein